MDGIVSNRFFFFGFSGKRSTRKMYHLEILRENVKYNLTSYVYIDRERVERAGEGENKRKW